MVDCRPCETRIDLKHKLDNDEGATTDKGQYQRLVGKLIYLAHTRPDIAYGVSVVSKFMHNPKDSPSGSIQTSQIFEDYSRKGNFV